MKIITLIALCTTLHIAITSAFAQNLPNKQTESLRAPEVVKIDGSATELIGKFSAYNPATEVYYTIANNDKFLYLTVQAESQDVINRMVNGGLTFTIVNKDQKNNKGISFTYPVKNDRSKILFALKPNRLVSFDTSPAGLEASMNQTTRCSRRSNT